MENSDNPLETVIQYVKNHDLLLLALPRGWWKNDILAIKMTNIILTCPISILTIYPILTLERYLRKSTNINIVKSDPSDKPYNIILDSLLQNDPLNV